jgi:outer membrane receptor for ferrienterochelin and colicins
LNKPFYYWLIRQPQQVILFLLQLLITNVYAQPVILQVKDKITGNPVEYAYVIARSINGSLQIKQLTDEKGQVELNADPPLIVYISCMGFRELADTLSVSGLYTYLLSPQSYQLDQVVITGQFRPQPVDKSIYKIEVIDNKQIHLKAANNLSDLLKTELGFQTRSEGILGDFIRIRGLSGEYIKVLIDGMPITGRVADRMDLGQLTLQNVDHIEVIEGPMSVVYGSNALAGAINIITADHSGKRCGINANTYYETVGIYNAGTTLSVKAGKHTFSGNAARNFFSGWGPEDTSRYKLWKPKLQYQAGLGYIYRLNNLKVQASSDYMHEELRDPGALTMANLYEKAFDGYHYTTRWNNRFNLINLFNDDFVLNIQAGHSYYRKRKITYLNDLVNLNKTLVADPEFHDTTDFNLISARGFVSNIPGKKFEYQTGFDINYESASGKRTGGYREMTDLSGFMNIVYRPVPTLSLQPGIRAMYNSDYRTPLVYGFSLKFNPDAFTIRVSYAKGFRAPSLKQLYLQFIDTNHEILGNENLKAETAHNFNLAAIIDRTFNRHSINFELSLYYNSIHNAIQLAINTKRPGWGTYFNVEGKDYKTKGAEVKVKYRFSPCFTLNAGIITNGRLRLEPDNKFDYSTDFVSSAIYLNEKYKIQFALFYKYTDEYLEFAGNYNIHGELDGIAQQYMAGYHTMDFNISKDFLKNTFNVTAGIRNVFNVTMVDAFGTLNIHGSANDAATAGYGRTFFIKLDYRFEKI